MYIAIVKTENNRVSKFEEFKTDKEAVSHIDKYGGQTHDNTSNTPIRDLWVDGESVTTKKVIDPVIVIEKSPVEKLQDLLVKKGVLTKADLK